MSRPPLVVKPAKRRSPISALHYCFLLAFPRLHGRSEIQIPIFFAITSSDIRHRRQHRKNAENTEHPLFIHLLCYENRKRVRRKSN